MPLVLGHTAKPPSDAEVPHNIDEPHGLGPRAPRSAEAIVTEPPAIAGATNSPAKFVDKLVEEDKKRLSRAANQPADLHLDVTGKDKAAESLRRSTEHTLQLMPHQEAHVSPKGMLGNVTSFMGDKWHALTHRVEPAHPRTEKVETHEPVKTTTSIGPVTPSPVNGAERRWRSGLFPARGDPDMAVCTDEEEALAERSDQFVKDAPLGLQEIANAEEAAFLHSHGAHVHPILSAASLHLPGYRSPQLRYAGQSVEERLRETEWERARERANWLRDEHSYAVREAMRESVRQPEGAEFVDDIVGGAPVRRLKFSDRQRIIRRDRLLGATADEAEKARLLANAPQGAELVEDIVAGAPVYRLSFPHEHHEHVALRDRMRGTAAAAERAERERLELLNAAPQGATVVEDIVAGAPIRRLASAERIHPTHKPASLRERFFGSHAFHFGDLEPPTLAAVAHADDIAIGAPVRRSLVTSNAAVVDQPALPQGAVGFESRQAPAKAVVSPTGFVGERPVVVEEKKQSGFFHLPSFLGGKKETVNAMGRSAEEDARWAREAAERAHGRTLKQIEEDAERVKRETARRSLERQNEAATDAQRVLADAQRMQERHQGGVLSGMKNFVSDKWDAFTRQANEAPHSKESATWALDDKAAEAHRKAQLHNLKGENVRANLREVESKAATKTSNALKNVQQDHKQTDTTGLKQPKRHWLDGLDELPDDEISLMTL